MNEDNAVPEYRGKSNAEIRGLEAAKFGHFMMVMNLIPVAGLLAMIAGFGLVGWLLGW